METQELSLFVECHEFLCSFDTRSLERLVLPEDVSPFGTDPAHPMVKVAGRIYASFNLGLLLGLPPTEGASVLVRAVLGGSELPLCFETGACLVVRPPEPTTRLVKGLFQSRRRALTAAFAVPPAMRRPGRSPVGLSLDIVELLSAKERESAARALRAALAKTTAASAP